MSRKSDEPVASGDAIHFTPKGSIEVNKGVTSWNLSELHTDMKWCLGLGIRAWAKGLVVRIDTAASEEGSKIQMMISQPFQFYHSFHFFY